MHPAIIIRTVRSLWTWLWGRNHVSQNVFLVIIIFNLRCTARHLKQERQAGETTNPDDQQPKQDAQLSQRNRAAG